MTDNRFDVQIGDRVTQIGDYNTGVNHYGPGMSVDPQVAFQELVAAVRVLREKIDDTDREIVEESLNSLGTASDISKVDKGRLRRFLATIKGVAGFAGQVGVPVIEAVKKVIDACQT